MGDALAKVFGVFILIVWLLYWVVDNLIQFFGG
jgi:hypothetical protein